MSKTKTKKFLAYLIKNHPRVSVTSLMKLSYLIDLVSVQNSDKRISNFEYERYLYGPFDYNIYSYLKELINEGVIRENFDFTVSGDEYIVYEFNDDNEEFEIDKLTQKEKTTIDEVLESLRGLGAKALTMLSYKTKPMEKIGAKLGNTENLNIPLDLKAR